MSHSNTTHGAGGARGARGVGLNLEVVVVEDDEEVVSGPVNDVVVVIVVVVVAASNPGESQAPVLGHCERCERQERRMLGVRILDKLAAAS